MPSSSLLDFEWPVARNGYVWVIGTPTGSRVSRGGVLMPSGYTSNWQGAFARHPMPFLIPAEQLITPPKLDALQLQEQFEAGEPIAIGVEDGKAFRPFHNEPALFLKFSALSGRFSEIQQFANRYGSLGGDCQIQFEYKHSDGNKELLWGEPPAFWSGEGASVRITTELWSLAQDAKSKDLEGLLDGEDDEIYLWFPELEGEDREDAPEVWIDSDRLRDLLKRRAPSAKVESFWLDQIATDAASYTEVLGQALVSSDAFHPERRAACARQGARVAARFCASDFATSGLKARVSPRTVWSGDEQRYRLALTPHSLLGAMWLQLAMAFDENRDYQRCAECGTWFEMAPGSGRPDKLYCSNACRMRSYRKRRGQRAQKKKAVR